MFYSITNECLCDNVFKQKKKTHNALKGTTPYSTYLKDPLQLNLDNGVFSLNDVDVLFTFNFDRDLKLTFSQGHKRFVQHYAIDGYHFVLGISHITIAIELLRDSDRCVQLE